MQTYWNDTLKKVSRPNVSGNKYHYIEWAKEVSGVGDVKSNTALERSRDSKNSNCRC